MDRGQMAAGGDDEAGSGDAGLATGLALEAAGRDPAWTEDARRLLREQARLAGLQADQLSEEGPLLRWSMRLKHASEAMKFAFELSVALVLVTIAAALAAAVWSAAHDNGLVIEAFSVPPDLAQRGLTGQVVASQLLDKLARMQAETNSIRPANSYRNNWGDDIKVEIPETGISIGELNRYLRNWLGHETQISGEIYRTPTGIAVTARARDAGTTFTGKDTDLDGLLQKAAESIYAETQPYRYAAFLSQFDRNPEAMSVLTRLSSDASPTERAWALSLLGNLYKFYNRPDEALAALREAVAADPTNAHVWDNLSNAEQSLDHTAEAYRDQARALALYEDASGEFDPQRLAIVKLLDRVSMANTLGDSQTAGALDEELERLPDRNESHFQSRVDLAGEEAFGHDFTRARAILSASHPVDANERLNLWFQTAGLAYASGDWRSLAHLIDEKTVFTMAPADFRPVIGSILKRVPNALLADALAESGDIAGARRLIATTPSDCYDCLRMRGKIEAAAKNWKGAAYWFARATDSDAIVPLAWCDWGTMLLAKGDAGGAIAKFSQASMRGPHFADPLEQWGEALMRENRSDLALAKFEDANRYAPRWGQLHLAWGEALTYVGRTSEARAQWSIATGLDLSASERGRLAYLIRSTVSGATSH
jgi:tetratricopeptide (TPR) repeat protein